MWPPDPHRSRLILIATGTYQDKNLPDLPAVARTVNDLQAVLTDPSFGVVSRRNCTLLADQKDIGHVGRHLRAAADAAEDLLLVYYIGHGVSAGRQHDLYLSLGETVWEAPEFTALEYDKVRSAVLDSHAATKMIILDCCYSGKAVSNPMADPVSQLISQSEVTGSYVLASTPRDKVSLILPGEERTAFTCRLLDLLRNGLPGGPEFLTAGLVYQWLRVKMKAEGLPEPQKRSSATADLLVLARNRAFAATTGIVLGQHRARVGQRAGKDDGVAPRTNLHNLAEQERIQDPSNEGLRHPHPHPDVGFPGVPYLPFEGTAIGNPPTQRRLDRANRITHIGDFCQCGNPVEALCGICEEGVCGVGVESRVRKRSGRPYHGGCESHRLKPRFELSAMWSYLGETNDYHTLVAVPSGGYNFFLGSPFRIKNYGESLSVFTMETTFSEMRFARKGVIDGSLHPVLVDDSGWANQYVTGAKIWEYLSDSDKIDPSRYICFACFAEVGEALGEALSKGSICEDPFCGRRVNEECPCCHRPSCGRCLYTSIVADDPRLNRQIGAVIDAPRVCIDCYSEYQLSEDDLRPIKVREGITSGWNPQN